MKMLLMCNTPCDAWWETTNVGATFTRTARWSTGFTGNAWSRLGAEDIEVSINWLWDYSSRITF